VAPVFVMADPADLRAQAMVRSPFSGRPTLYLYDACPGGVGYARRIFRQFEEILTAARQHLAACPCAAGCPSCVGAAVESGDRAKPGAGRILRLAAATAG
jgi:DEAD/DEAH box helicase domain-containing protein